MLLNDAINIEHAPKVIPKIKIFLLPKIFAKIGNVNPPNIYPTKNNAATNAFKPLQYNPNSFVILSNPIN